jgi:hypothetical protein
VVVLSGGRVPYVLQRKGEHYVLIGEALVHGITYGEFVEVILVALFTSMCSEAIAR